MLALSATYPESLAQHLTHYMREPTFVRLNPKDMVLKGEILLKLYFTLYQANNMTHQQCLVYILKPYSVNKLTAVPANRDFQNKTADITQVLRPNCYSPMYVVLARPPPGLKQYYKLVQSHSLPHKVFEEKVQHLLELFSKIPFNQALVFSNLHTR